MISNALLVKAYLPEVPVSVDGSCCAGVTPESHETALAAMRMCQGKKSIPAMEMFFPLSITHSFTILESSVYRKPHLFH